MKQILIAVVVMLCLICLTACGVKETIRPVVEYKEIECPVPDAPETPEYLQPQWNFFDTEAGRKYCTNADGARYEGANVKRVRAALKECQQIMIELNFKKNNDN